jgi:hypothetical protein
VTERAGPPTLFEVPPPGGYERYDDVPLYRKQWFFWLTWLLLPPVAMAVLITGDVYYEKDGAVKRFGMANRIAAAILAALICSVVIRAYLDAIASSQLVPLR